MHNLVLNFQILEDSLLGLTFQNFFHHSSDKTLSCGPKCHTWSTCPEIHLDFLPKCLIQSSLLGTQPLYDHTYTTSTCSFELFQKKRQSLLIGPIGILEYIFDVLVDNRFSFSAFLENLPLITSQGSLSLSQVSSIVIVSGPVFKSLLHRLSMNVSYYSGKLFGTWMQKSLSVLEDENWVSSIWALRLSSSVIHSSGFSSRNIGALFSNLFFRCS